MDHTLVPKHEILTEEEKAMLEEEFTIRFTDLPRISISDSAIKELEAKEGDIIKITRSSLTAGTSIFYRGVVND